MANRKLEQFARTLAVLQQNVRIAHEAAHEVMEAPESYTGEELLILMGRHSILRVLEVLVDKLIEGPSKADLEGARGNPSPKVSDCKLN